MPNITLGEFKRFASLIAGQNSNLGTFTANSTSAVTVADTKVTANSVIVFTAKTVAGTPSGAPYIATITPGTGFTVKAGSGDTSVYNYRIIG